MVSGVQFVPNRKSIGLTIEKKRPVSKMSEAMMPNVVTIATKEAMSSANMTSRSTRSRAGKVARHAGESVTAAGQSNDQRYQSANDAHSGFSPLQ